MTHPAMIAVIGAGPAGLMAAEILAAAGHAVTVYDHKPTPGRKFLMAGRGGLNLTHGEALPEFLRRYGDAPMVRTAVESFTPADLRAWADGLGEPTFVGSSGRVFPKSFKASPLLRAWRARLDAAGVKFLFNRRWSGWDANGALTFTDGQTAQADATLLALGGASWPRLGSDGAWTCILEARGVSIAPLRPSNCGFTVAWPEGFRHAGQPIKPVTLRFGALSVKGEMMLTSTGVEGGAVYALSAPLRDALARDGQAVLHVDLRPGLTLDILTERLGKARGRQSLSNFLRKAAGIDGAAFGVLRAADGFKDMPPAALATLIKNAPLRLNGVAGLDRAISTAGGIAFAGLDDRFMLKAVPGFFAAGEMLDWEAPTGGYLLQAAFATAIAAAKGMIAWLSENSAPPERH